MVQKKRRFLPISHVKQLVVHRPVQRCWDQTACDKRSFVSNPRYICPKPVLANDRFPRENGAKKSVFCTCDKRGCPRAAVIALALAAEQGVIRRKSGLVAAVTTVISGQHEDCVVPHLRLPQLRCEVADADVEHVQRGHVVGLPGPLLPLRRAV
eukprot:COSAG06_NODE_1618_length_8914_cov_10.299830_5_plen_154_part_00